MYVYIPLVQFLRGSATHRTPWLGPCIIIKINISALHTDANMFDLEKKIWAVATAALGLTIFLGFIKLQLNF